MHSTLPFYAVGITHHHVDLGTRERLARSRSEIVALLAGEKGRPRLGIPLSTCNRFEVYWWGEQDWEEWFLSSARDRGVELPSSSVMRESGVGALRHLFEVAAGLDAQVVGETEILGQVRRAWGLAREIEATNQALDTVFAAALAAGRRVRKDTSLGQPSPSLGGAAVEAARTRLGGSLSGCSILVIGAGDAAHAVLRALNGSPAHVHVTSRRIEKTRRLCEGSSASVEPWDALDDLLQRVDIAFAATAAPHSLLTAERLANARQSGVRPLTLVDLGVPRNVGPGAGTLKGITVIDLDDLPGHSLERTGVGEDVAVARAILDRELERLQENLWGLEAGGRLADLHRHGAKCVEEEVAAALEELDPLTGDQSEVIRKMAERLVRRVLYPASKTLRSNGGPASRDATSLRATTGDT